MKALRVKANFIYYLEANILKGNKNQNVNKCTFEWLLFAPLANAIFIFRNLVQLNLEDLKILFPTCVFSQFPNLLLLICHFEFINNRTT